jgi:hypothetical protein
VFGGKKGHPAEAVFSTRRIGVEKTVVDSGMKFEVARLSVWIQE